MKKIVYILMSTVLLISSLSATGQNTQKYYLSSPLRDGETETFLQLGENNGTKLMAMASCERCPAAIYQINPESTEAFGKDVYGKSGIYVLTYDENSFVMVMPEQPVMLGNGIWESFAFSNFVSRDKSKARGMDSATIESWAKDISNKIMTTGIAGTSANSLDVNSTIYYPAVKKVIRAGKPQGKVDISYNKEELKLYDTAKKYGYTYTYRPEYSKLLGVDIYGDDGNRREYAFVQDENTVVILYFSYTNDLGRKEFGEYDTVEYYSKSQQTSRQLLVSEEKQSELEKIVIDWTKKASDYKQKKYEEQEAEEIANQTLPKQGLKDATLEAQALIAAKNWANQYNWEETVTNAYFTSNDWSIIRNRRTGIQIKRTIRGVIVMKRKDGLCSFHYAEFGQAYNGSGYQKVYTEGIVPGQYKLNCSKVW